MWLMLECFDSEGLMSYLGEDFPGSLESGAGAGERGWADRADTGISVTAKATTKAECGDRTTKGSKRELEFEKPQLGRTWYRKERLTSPPRGPLGRQSPTGLSSSPSFHPSRECRGVLVSWGCHDELPQTGWVSTTEMCSLTVQEARSLK